jgi:hypothetical protein
MGNEGIKTKSKPIVPKRGIAAMFAVVALVLGGLATAAPATALGSSTRWCNVSTQFSGQSTSSQANTTKGSTSCGNVGVSARYYYPGSEGTSTTAWSYGTYGATVYPPAGYSVLNGYHLVTQSSTFGCNPGVCISGFTT